MADVESRMWWYRNLHHNILALLERSLGQPLAVGLRGKKVLDAGCGTGGVLSRLEQAAPEADFSGIDISEQAVAFAREKTAADVQPGNVNELPYPDGQFDVIISADVLYHQKVDQDRAILEFRRCLKPSGLLLVNLPAYGWLRSSHDVNVGGARRYTLSGARRLLETAGFMTIRATYWNTVLFPLMVVKRKLAGGKTDRSDVSLMPPFAEAAFLGITAVERFVLKKGLTLPYGGSVMWCGANGADPQ